MGRDPLGNYRSDIYSISHSSSKNSYEVTAKISLWLGVPTTQGCNTGEVENVSRALVRFPQFHNNSKMGETTQNVLQERLLSDNHLQSHSVSLITGARDNLWYWIS